MKGKKKLVVVLSRYYSTGLSIVRSLGEAGYAIELVVSSYKKGCNAPLLHSRYVRKYTEVVEKTVKESGYDSPKILEALLQYKGAQSEKPVLFPTDDYSVAVIDRNRSQLEEIFIMPTIVGGGDGCILEKSDKVHQSDMARQAGLLTPLEWIIPLEDKHIPIPKDMVYPCFVKPLASISGYKKEMAQCKDKKALRKHLKELRKHNKNRSVLVQEYLKIEQEIDFSGVCLDQEIIIPAIVKKLNVAKYEKGVTMAGKILPVDSLGELMENIKAMLRLYHYVGMFDMELNVVDGKVYFNEVNLRCGGPNFSYFMSGVNLPALFVGEALGRGHTPEQEQVTQLGKTFLYEKVAYEDYIHGFMTKQGLKDRVASADMTLITSFHKDPAPEFYFYKGVYATMVYRKLKKVKNRLVKSLKKMKKGLSKFLSPAKKLLRKVKYAVLGYPQTKKENRRNPFSDNPRVVVAGRNFSSNLTMARSLGMAGYDVEILRVFQVRPKLSNLARYLHPDTYSKYVKAYHVCVSRRKPKNIVKKLIKIADPYRKMLLIPTCDLLANVSDEYMRKLRRYYIMPNIRKKPGEISKLMCKDVQKELAAAAGLPIVNSCVISTHNQKFEIPDSVTYPCFIKPNVSKNSAKSKMRRCDSKKELESSLKEFSKKKDIEMLVEDFVDIKQEYALLGLSTTKGVVAPGFFCTELGGHDGHRGVAMTGRILSPNEEEQALIDQIVKFIEGLHFNGLFDVDLILTADNKMYFTELNLRFGASGYAVSLCGVNLPGMFADYMLHKKPIDLACTIKESDKTFISEKIMLDEYMHGYLTKSEMMKLFKEADIHFIYDSDDSAAYRHFRFFYLPAAVFKFMLAHKNKKHS